MSFLERWRQRRQLSARADLREGAGGWTSRVTGVPIFGTADRPADEQQRQYAEALAAWRANPYAKRVIDIITDYTVGDGITPIAPGEIGRFVDTFWTHPQNRLDLRLPDLMDELSRAGDLFLALFRNPADGMSYVRAVPKSAIVEIVTAGNDWEREVAYVVRSDRLAGEQGSGGAGGKEAPAGDLLSPLRPGSPAPLLNETTFLSPAHPDAPAADAIMLHYSINRP
ncbi:hypothetical protein, partial [Promineifilum sp.]|uniref:hypothetical protein n=1 Tax=Promineifilum sp. TaxID=2664178 RepID=UPI0035B0223A